MDSEGHWKQCQYIFNGVDCGKRPQFEPHDFENDYVRGVSVCKVCGYELQELF